MDDLLEFAVAAAREAGAATLRHFQSPGLEVRAKAGGSPVTRADLEAEQILRGRIAKDCPGDGILGEEFGEEAGRTGRIWIVDPVDGTKSFARGVPLYGTLIGLEEEGQAVLGIAYLPALREMVYAARGRGATWVTGIGGVETARPARVSAVARPDEAMFCTTSVGGFVRSDQAELYERLRGAHGSDRGWSDCYGHVLVATGRAEVMVDPRMEVWDCAALQPMVEEAGGVFTDLFGNATHRGGSAVSANPALHEHVMALCRGSAHSC